MLAIDKWLKNNRNIILTPSAFPRTLRFSVDKNLGSRVLRRKAKTHIDIAKSLDFLMAYGAVWLAGY
jgi:hypothetical protein